MLGHEHETRFKTRGMWRRLALKYADWAVLVALACSTALKLWWACHSAGSVDAVLFFNFGKALAHSSLRGLYEHEPLFNHTPMVGCTARALWQICQGDFICFSIALRFISILADIGVVLALLHVRRLTGRPAHWLVTLFALSPVSLMVSGFHGNVDPVMVLCLVLAAAAVLDGRVVVSGLLFGLACNIKVVPIVLLPVFFLFWRQRGRSMAFAISCGTLLLIGSLWPLWQCPASYLRNVFGYSSFWGTWGISYWLRMTGVPALQKIDFHGLTQAQVAIMAGLKILVVGAITWLGWRRRAVPPPEFLISVLAAWTILFVFAPGAGPQYLVWVAPFVLFAAPLWPVALTVCSSAFLFVFYYTTSRGEFPFVFSLPLEQHVALWGPSSNLPWLALVALLIVEGRGWGRQLLTQCRLGKNRLVAPVFST